MNKKTSVPGVSRENRISEEGLQRLESLLARGGQVSQPVLAQWIRRYGDPARDMIKRHGQYDTTLDAD